MAKRVTAALSMPVAKRVTPAVEYASGRASGRGIGVCQWLSEWQRQWQALPRGNGKRCEDKVGDGGRGQGTCLQGPRDSHTRPRGSSTAWQAAAATAPATPVLQQGAPGGHPRPHQYWVRHRCSCRWALPWLLASSRVTRRRHCWPAAGSWC